jgi:type I restriction enzyme R subunit
MAGTGVIDIFAEAGLDKPDISVIDDDFRRKFEASDQKHLQLEAVRRLISSEVKIIGKRNVVAGRKFSEMLSEALNRYQNRTIDAAGVIAEIVEIAKAIQAQRQRGEETGLTDNELAFYDALSSNESARFAMRDETLQAIAHELTGIFRRDVKTDWQVKETVRAKLRARIKRLLLRHGYPPDQEPAATALVIQQAEAMAESEDNLPSNRGFGNFRPLIRALDALLMAKTPIAKRAASFLAARAFRTVAMHRSPFPGV